METSINFNGLPEDITIGELRELEEQVKRINKEQWK